MSKANLKLSLSLIALMSVHHPLYSQTDNGSGFDLPNVRDWWLIRDADSREICQGFGNDINRGEVDGCASLPEGTYIAYNLSDGAPGLSVVIGNSDEGSLSGVAPGAGSNDNQPVGGIGRIQFPNNQWWLVRNSVRAEICQGSGNDLSAGRVQRCPSLIAGTYTVFNLTTGGPGVPVTVTDAEPGGNTDSNSPIIASGQDGSTLSYQSVFTDHFNGSRLDKSKWKFIDMTDGLHRAGNQDIDRDGNAAPNDSVSGKRWSAWYDNHQNTVTRVENGNLVMGGLFTNEPDPTRISYNDNGLNVNFNDHKLYTSFLSTWDRIYSNSAGGHITDPNGPDRTWGPGHFFEMNVSFAEMNTRAFRLSWYLLPAYDNAPNSYDGNISNGIENDLFEFDPSPGGENILQMKVISGDAAGNTPGGSVNLRNFNLRSGYHTIGLLWQADRFVWYVDGIEVQRDEFRVPSVPHYMVISREMNSGAKSSVESANDLQAIPPYLPQDVGIWATNVWRDRANINTDVGRIDYVKVWRIR